MNTRLPSADWLTQKIFRQARNGYRTTCPNQQRLISRTATMSAPTAAQVQSLYNATRAAASKFTTYNFRSHFIRRADEVFKPVISSLQSGSSSSSSSTPTASSSSSASTTLGALDLSAPMSAQALTQFYNEHVKELEVLKRSAEVNRMFEGPKLVVEHPRIITSGGGAGMEASAGGGGQPE